MPRLFIALPLSDNAENETSKELYCFLNKFDKELKVVSPENYHVTLKFLGECSEKTAKKIEESFTSISEINKTISFTLFGLGVFPDLKNPNVIWAGLRTDEALINKLNLNVENFTSGFGFRKEKNKFMPHLTLARIRKGKKLNEIIRQYIVENKELFFYESSFTKLVLFSSTLTKEGPVYTELKALHFGQ